MKTRLDPRHQHRQKLITKLYSYSFNPKKTRGEIKPIIIDLIKIDSILGKAAPEWPVEKLNKVDLAILRLAIWELIIEKINPPKVVIDEAVELAKEFGADNSPSFVNGVLGTILSNQNAGQNP